MALQADDRSTRQKCPADIEVYWPLEWLEKFEIVLLAKYGMDYDELLREPTERIQVPIPKNHRREKSDTEREQRITANQQAMVDYRTACGTAWETD